MLSSTEDHLPLDESNSVDIDVLLPRLRLIAAYYSEDAASHVLTSVRCCNFAVVLAALALRFPLMRVWLHEICDGSVAFIHLCDEKWSDEDVIVYLKSLRVLLNRGYFSLSTQSRNFLRIDHLIAFSSRKNPFIKYQLQMLLNFDANRNTHDFIAADLLLEAVLAGADKKIKEFDVDSAAQSIEERIIGASMFIAVFDHHLLVSSQVNISGYLLPVQIKSKPASLTPPHGFVLTETVQENIAQLTAALHSFQPIILHGVSGAGKSSLIHELARTLQMEDDLVVLHVSDQTDCKALIGSYACTNVPGEFIWIPGIVTTAATNGQWVVVEDIDQVPLEFISLIAPLLESRRYFIPALGTEIVAHHNFRVFATRNLHATSYRMLSTPSSVALSEKQLVVPQLYHYFQLWSNVVVHPVGLSELRSIIAQLYPSVYGSLIDLLLNTLYGDSSVATEYVNMREALRIIERIGTYSKEYHNLSGFVTDGVKVMAWQELVEVLVLKCRNPDQLVSMAFHYAFRLGLHQGDVEEQFRISPQLSIHPSINGKSIVRIGRCSIDSSVDLALRNSLPSSSYSQTAYARRLLERLAVCVSMNEPVLLVGETGNGKTTNVQELARIVGQKLVVLNLSLSSDIGDLLGGYRPMSTKQLFKPVYEQFVNLFHETLSSAKNNEFLQKTNSFFLDQSWSKLLKAIEKACESAMGKLQQARKESSTSDLEDKIDRWSDYLKSIVRYRENLAKIKSGFAFSFVRGLLLEAFEHGYWILLDEINLASAETLQGLSGFLDTKQKSTVVEGHDSHGKPQKVLRHSSFRIFAAMNPPTDVCKKELPAALKTRFTEFYVPELVDEDDLFQIVTGFFPGITDIPASTIVSVYLQCRKLAEERLVDGSGQKPHYSLRTLTRSLKCALSFLSINLRPMSRCLFEGFYLNFGMMLNEKSQAYMFEYLKDSLWGEDNKKDLSFPPQRPRSMPNAVLVKPFWIARGSLEPEDWSAKNSLGISKFVLTPTVDKYIRSLAAAISVTVAPILLQGPTSIGKTSMIHYLAAKVGRKCVRINNHEHTDIQEYVGGYVTDTDGRLVFKDGLLVEALRNGYWIILDELNLAPSDILEALNRLLDDNQELLITETGEIVKPADGFQLFATQNPPGIYGGRKPLSLAFRNRFIEIHMGDLPNKEIEEIIAQSCGIAPKFSAMMVKTMEELQMHRQQSALLLGKHGMITTRDLIKWGKRQPQSNLDVAYMGFMLLGEKLRTKEEQSLVEQVLRDVCKVKEPLSLSTLAGAQAGVPGFVSKASSSLTVAQEKIRGNQLHLDGVKGIAITNPIMRMWTLLCEALNNSEPVLLVGETGCGKTMVCQLYSAFMGLPFRAVNCHQSTETADLIGGLRPVRSRDAIKSEVVRLLNTLYNEGLFLSTSLRAVIADNFPVSPDIDDTSVILLCQAVFELRDHTTSASLHQTIDQLSALSIRLKSLFEWVDGPLIDAMKNGDFFLLDEINLAEDAVIERLNSVLEFNREITLAEKGGHNAEQIVAHPKFRIVATMNPSGDFGKRELSPALRSRFTEVWIPASNSFEDFASIISEILRKGIIPQTLTVVAAMIEFMKWFNQFITSYIHGFVMTIRELIAWSDFVNVSRPSSERQVYACMVHGAFLSLLDGVGIGHNISRDKVAGVKLACLDCLLSLCPIQYRTEIQKSASFLVLPDMHEGAAKPHYEENFFVIGDYRLPVGPESILASASYATDAPTTLLNLGRIARAMSIKRPILLEGPPGVGKTSIITHLASLTGHKLVRINLSEHTELSDLLGSDLPCQDDGPEGPLFKWYDGILLKAMKEGSWVLLDELNLAPQTVLEGLNACFDHREQVYLPDIGQTVVCAPSFRVFTAQNPMTEGGGRKGLPASFLSRFTRVFMESLTSSDITRILFTAYSEKFVRLDTSLELTRSLIVKMVEFVETLHRDIVVTGKYGRQGSPWEFNLRDMLRWCDSICYGMQMGSDFYEAIMESAYLLFVLRMRSEADREEVCRTFNTIFAVPLTVDIRPVVTLAEDGLWIGRHRLAVGPTCPFSLAFGHSFHYDAGYTFQQFLHSKPMEMLLHSVSLSLPVLVVGKQGSGRRSTVEQLGKHLGIEVRYFTATPSLDTSEMLGAFEQSNKYRSLNRLVSSLENYLYGVIRAVMLYNPNDCELLERIRGIISAIGHLGTNGSSEQTAVIIHELAASVSQLKGVIDGHEYYGPLRPSFSSFSAFLESEQVSNAIKDTEYGFVWLNGVIVDAMEKGNWVIFDNVNLCSSSVLDRLNSVLESNGELILNEDGTGRKVERHENFRIFLIMDPSLGEVSRAMRNRCVEVFYSQAQIINETSAALQSLEDSGRFSQSGYFQGDLSSINKPVYPFLIKSKLSGMCNFGSILLKVIRRDSLLNYLDQSALSLLYQTDIAPCIPNFLMKYIKAISSLFGSQSMQLYERNKLLIDSFVSEINVQSLQELFASPSARTSLLAQLSLSQGAPKAAKLITKGDRQIVHVLQSLIDSFANSCGVSFQNLPHKKTVSYLLLVSRAFEIVKEKMESSASTPSSLYSVSLQVNRKDIAPSNRDFILAGYLWPILSLTENIITVSTSSYGTKDGLSNCCDHSVGYLIMNLVQMRTLLVRVLLSHSLDCPLQGSFWSTSMIIVKWIEKSLTLLFSHDMIQDNAIGQSIKDSAKHALKNFHDHYCLFWDNAFVLVKLTLWKQGGHGSVSLRLSDWAIKNSFLNLLHSFCLSLPNFLDHGVDGAISTLPVYRSTALGGIIDEWLALLCTFTWQSTNELGIALKLVINDKRDMDATSGDYWYALIDSVAKKLSAATILPPDFQMLEGRSDMQEILSNPNALSLIRAELKNRVVLAAYFYADLIVLDLTEQLLSKLSDFILSFQQHNKSNIRVITALSKRIIRLAISHSTYHPRLLRPFKALTWVLEYITAQERLIDTLVLDVKQILRSYLVEISGIIYLMKTSNIVNNANRMDFSFGSPTLAGALGVAESHLIYAVNYRESSEIKGTSEYAHTISMPFALRHIDMRLICEKMTSLHSIFARSAHTTEVTIASYFRVKTAVSIAFKCSVARKMLCIKKSLSYSRLSLILRDVLHSIQHLFIPEYCQVLKQILLEEDFIKLVGSVESSEIIEQIPDIQFKDTFTRCLRPIFLGIRTEITQENLSHWLVCLAVLKLQLLLASLFTDPALRAQQKHTLLIDVMHNVKSVVNLNISHKLIAEDCAFSEETIGHLKLLEEYKKKDKVYQQKIIERPVEALSYDEMFSFIKNLVLGPLSSRVILDFASSLHTIYMQLMGGDTTVKGYSTITQQESQLQSMIFSCMESLRKDFYHYSDVTSAFEDCFSMISQGIRSLLTSTSNIYSRRKLERKIKLNGVECVTQHAWSMVLSTSVRSMACTAAEYFGGFLKSDGWLKHFLQDALQGRDVAEGDAAQFVDLVSKFLAISKADLLLSSRQVRIAEIEREVSGVFEEVSQRYLDIARDKKIAKQQQSSLYTHRKASSESNERTADGVVDEEIRELRENFPSYAEELDRALAKDDEEFDVAEVVAENSSSVGQKLKNWNSQFFQEESNLLHIISIHLRTLTSAHYSRSIESSHFMSLLDNSIESHYRYVYFAMKLFQGLEGNHASGLMDRLNLEEMFCYRYFHGFLEERGTDKLNPDVTPQRSLIDRDLLYLLDPLPTHRLSSLSLDSGYNPWNFHFDSNIPDALAANPILNNILQQAISFLQVLPNNDVLHRIIKLTHAISHFSASTPLGKLFQSLQVLLKCIQQYEEFAHSKISFSSELSSIFQLLHRYHAIQIKSWQSLLRHEEIKYVRKAALFWFSLHKVFIQDACEVSKRFRKYKRSDNFSPWKTLAAQTPSWLSSCKSADEDSSATSQQIEEYLVSQIKVLEAFLMDSNVGEFPTRLHLVRYVANALEGKMAGSYFLQKLHSLVVGLWYTSSYFLPIVRDFQLLLLGPLQQQVKDEVKMSKWDNITIVAMLENTEKAHRKLQKFIKQYKEDVLEYPVRRLIFRENMKDIVSDSGETIDVVQVPLDSVLFPTTHKMMESSNILDTVSEFSNLYENQMKQSSWKADDSRAIFDVVDRRFPNCRRTDKIVSKAERFIRSAISFEAQKVVDDPFTLSGICVGINTAVILEDRSDAIFERIGQLRCKDATRPQKQKALRDLLDVLKDEGFSHLRSEIPKNISNVMETISLGSTLHEAFSRFMSHSFAVSLNANIDSLFQRAESYIVKCFSEISQLRVQYATASHGDISNQEKIHMMTFSDSMLHASLKLRCSVEAGISSSRENYYALRSLRAIRDYFSSYLSKDLSIDPYIPFDSLKLLCEENLGVFRAVATDMFTALSVFEFAGAPPNFDHVDVDMEAFSCFSAPQMQTIAQALRSIRLEILECVRACTLVDTEYNLGTFAHDLQMLSVSSETVLVSIDKLTSQADLASKCCSTLMQHKDILERIVGSSKLSFIVQSLQKVAKAADSGTTSSGTPASVNDVTHGVNGIIEKIMLSVQNMNTLHSVLSKNGSYKNDLRGCYNELLLSANEVLPENKPITMLLSWAQASLAFTSVEGLPKLTKALTAVISSLTPPPSRNVLQALHLLLVKVCDLAAMHSKAYTALIDQNVFAYKSLSKFLYINIRIFRNLLSKGFCSAESKEGDGEGDGQGGGPTDWGEDQEGTGMGEGEGKKDVSDQITNEEQLLDLKKSLEDNEKEASKPEKSSEKLDKEEQDKGVEMDQDFEGDMFDMENAEENEDDEEKDDEESIDREMDHNDQEINMENVVSEKQWGDSDDEDEDDKGDGKEKFEKNSSMKGPTIPDEMRTKEDNEEEDGDGKDDFGKEKEQKGTLGDNPPVDDNDKEKINEEEVVDKPMGVDVEKEKEQKEDSDSGVQGDDKETASEGDDEGDNGDGVEEFKEYADDKEMPEGEGKEGPEAEGGQDADGEDMDVEALPDNMEIPGGEDGEEDQDGSQTDQADPLSSEVMDVDDKGETEQPDQDNNSINGNKDDDAGKESKPLTYGVQDDNGEDDIMGSNEQQQSSKKPNAGHHKNESNESKNANEGSSANQDKSSASQKGSRQQQQSASSGEKPKPEDASHDAGSSPQDQVDQADNDGNAKRSTRREPPNPFLHKGDLRKEWFRRLNIADSQVDQPFYEEDDEQMDGDEAGQEGLQDLDKGNGLGDFEYDDSKQKDGEQVLGAVRKDDAVQLPEQNEVKSAEPVNEQKDRPERKRDLDSLQDEQKQQRGVEEEENTDDNVDDVRQKVKRTKLNDEKHLNDNENNLEGSDSGDAEESVMEEDETDQEDIKPKNEDDASMMEDLNTNVAQTNRQFVFGSSLHTNPSSIKHTSTETEDFNVDKDSMAIVASDIHIEQWQRYLVQTESYAMQLSEQLRLIIEPTLASRLQGDYRTGKRINMRRVISYVASGYRKDKIWLRRTKLAKRAYQVMLLIDDSRSMGLAGDLALQSMALLATALSRLEIGELAVCSFADKLRVLHHFNETFSSQSGGKILSQFKFEANSTRLSESLRAIIPIFNEAKEGSPNSQVSNQAVLQLCFVISDARIDTENRVRLEQIIREMAEKHILVVLVIIDVHANSRDSIFNTRSVSFVDNKVVTTSYLDNFPFPYYVVIQDLQRLPEVLADALKQWFELIKLQLANR